MNDMRFEVVKYKGEIVGRVNSMYLAHQLVAITNTTCDIYILDNDGNRIHDFFCDSMGNVMSEFTDSHNNTYKHDGHYRIVDIDKPSPVGVVK